MFAAEVADMETEGSHDDFFDLHVNALVNEKV